MAHSYIKYNGDGETVGPYVLPFPYISTTHIEVTVDGIEVTFSWLTSSTIQLDSAPAAGTVIFIKRKTARDSRLVDYTGGSVLSEEDLDTDSKQAFYLVQEAYDWITLNADEDGLVFQDRDVMLNALTGYLDTSHLTEQLHQNLNYMVEKFFTLDAILDPSAGTDAVLEHGIVESPLSAINYAGIDVVADSAQIVQNVAAISTNASGVSYNAAEISLLADEYMVRLDANGYVAGFGLYNGGVGQSEFIVNADKFAMVNGSGTGKKYPFVVTSDVVYIDGDLLVTGSVDTDHLAADAITTAKIAADAVTATEINVSTLSAVAADVGVVTAGVLKSDNWSSTAGTWLDLDDGGLWIRSGNGIFIEQGGDITLEGK